MQINVEDHLPLVSTIASKIYYKYKTTLQTHTKEDLFQYGVEGLIKAAKGFNGDKGYKFSSYAYTAIQRSIMFAIRDTDSYIRKPYYIYDDIMKYYKVLEELGITPNQATVDTLSEKLGISKERVISITETVDNYKRYKSLDTSLPNTEDLDYYDLISDLDMREEIDTKYNYEILYNCLSKLKDKWQQVLTYKYGLGGAEPMNGAEIGRKLGVSRESIRQIEKRAISKLRTMMCKKEYYA